MKSVIYNNSSRSDSIKDSTNFLRYGRPKTTIETSKSHVNSQKDSKNDSIRRSAHVHLDNHDDRCTTFRLNELHKDNPKYHSLSFNHLQGTGTKRLINIDTFSQTKKLFYTDHQKSPNDCSKNLFKTKDIHESLPNSVDSLNSSDDPEIVAAIDQIASKMGLIDYEVSRMSNDPVNYLLKTRSFSERISIYKNSPNHNRTACRIQSFVDHTGSNKLKLDNINFQKSSITPKKKESSFRKMIQHFSPKLLRRTKSTSPSPSPSQMPTLIFNRNSTKQTNLKDLLLTVNSLNSNSYNAHSIGNAQKESIENISENNKNPKYVNYEQKDSPLPGNEPVIRSLTLSSARYINISVSAFGYGPISSLSTLSPVKRSIYQTKSNHKNDDISGDQNYTNEEKFNPK